VRGSWVRVVAVVALVAVLAVVMGSAPASARRVIDDVDDDGGGGGGGDGGGSDDGGSGTDCLGGISALFTADPTEVKFEEFTTLHWYVDVPPDCPEMTLSISGIGSVSRNDAREVQVMG